MSSLYLFRFLLGYVRFSATGPFPERFLNLISAGSARVWGGTRKENRLVLFTIAKDYKKLRTPARKAGLRLNLEKKYGFPFFLFKHRKRLGFFTGIALFALILFILSLFVWRVEISGNEIISDKVIMDSLKKNGLDKGSYTQKINEPDISQKVLLEIKGLSYVTIFIRGSVAEVKVIEASLADDKEKLPCNIVSDAEGEILSVDVYRGTAAVKKGQKVVKNQLLVNGVVDSTVSNTLVHSSANITAKTDREISASVPYNYTCFKLFHNPYRRKSIYFFGAKFPLYVGRLPKSNYTVTDIYEKASLFEKEIPVGFYTEYHYPYGETTVTLTKNQAIRIAEIIVFLSEIKETSDGEIIEKSQKLSKSDSECSLTAKYRLKEKIGVISEINHTGGESQ